VRLGAFALGKLNDSNQEKAPPGGEQGFGWTFGTHSNVNVLTLKAAFEVKCNS
jgi:hypothetical protein